MNPAHIMIVEDNTTVAEDVRECLESLGYRVTDILASGEDAIEKAEARRPDAILMDIRLRGAIDGIEAAEQIYSRFRIPVVFLSAYSDSKLLQRAKRVGAFGYLVKPFEERELYAMLEMAIYKANAERERQQAQEQLQEALHENTTLLRELRHRVQNSFVMLLSMIELMKNSSTASETKAALGDIRAKMHAMADLYRLLSTTQSLHAVQLDDYLRRLASSFPFPSDAITFERRFESVIVTVKDALPIGLIVSELITNSLKHAFPDGRPGLLTLQLEKTPAGAQLIYTDNGVGFRDDIDTATADSLGIKLLHALTQQLGGSLTLENDNGVRCLLQFTARESAGRAHSPQ